MMRIVVLAFRRSLVPFVWVLMTLASSAAAQSTMPAGALQDSVAKAASFIKDGEEDRAIDLMESVILGMRQDLPRLRDAYLVLVWANLVKANRFRDAGDDKTADLWESKAKDSVVECLSTRELRHTRPEPDEDFYPEKKKLFDEVRNELFGSFRISKLTPVHASVVLDGDSLFSHQDGSIEEEDIPVGERLLVIRADGYKTITETLVVLPGTRHTQTYEMDKKKGFFWYASRGAVAAAVVVAGGIVASGGDDSPADPEPLPGPPAPPG